MKITLLLAAVLWSAAGISAASPFADTIVAYKPGVGASEGFQDADSALGEPTRFTSPDNPFGGAVTPFNSPFGTDELVSIGEGGSLTVRFAQPVTDDSRNPFGIDLLVFGNSFQALGGGVFAEGGIVEVSADGVDFIPIPGIDADGAFPTLGFQDLIEPFPGDAGSVLTDFTRPVDPALDPTGLDIVALSAAYAGSGGGAGVDLATTGLSEISYVRIVNPVGSGITPEIDAFADVSPVPEPTTTVMALVMGAGLAAASRRCERR